MGLALAGKLYAGFGRLIGIADENIGKVRTI